MAGGGFRLGVDFGTSTTVAVLRWPDGTVRPLVFDGSELMPSAVYAAPDSTLLVGRDALHAGRANPAALEPNPKRCVDDGTVLLGDAEVPVVELFAAVLRRVAAEAGRVAGTPVRSVVLTCPAGWGPHRRAVLLDAARAAGVDEPALEPEPVAAAGRFVELSTHEVAVGSCVLVYDFGAGTFDASVVRRTRDGFDVLAAHGLPDAGGLDVDAAIVGYLAATYGARNPALWRRLTRPEAAPDRRAARLLWDDVRTAKEVLSNTGTTTISLPLLDEEVPLGREQFDALAGPIVGRTVRATRAALSEAGVGADAVAGLFLVGGSSRIPLVATMLHRELGIAPTLLDRPELVVAEGSLRGAPLPAEPTTRAVAPPPAEPAREPDPVTAPEPATEPRTVTVPEPPPAPVSDRTVGSPATRRGRRVAIGAALLAVCVLAVSAWTLWPEGDPPAKGGAAGTASPTPPVMTPTQLKGHTGPVKSVAFSLDGQLVSGGEDRTLRRWNLETGASTVVYTHGQYPVGFVTFSPDRKTVAANTLDAVHLRNIATGRAGRVVDGHPSYITEAAFSPDGKLVATVGDDTTLQLWDVATGTRKNYIFGHDDIAWCAAWSRTGLLATCDGSRVQLWDAKLARKGRFDNDANVRDVEFSPDGRTLAIAEAAHGRVLLWDVATGKVTGTIDAGASVGGVRLAFNRDGTALATVTSDSDVDRLVVWNLATRTPKTTVTGHDDRLNAVAFDPTSDTLVAAGQSGAIWMWRLT